MMPKNKCLLQISALCLVLCMLLGACGVSGNQDTTAANTEKKTFYVELYSEGGSPLPNVTVYVYADNSLTDLVAFAVTDQDGKANFVYNDGQYVAVLVNVPEGYLVEESYPITSENTVINLPVELVQGDLETVTYQLGGVMQDFTFTAADGTEYALSQLLQEKKAVVLNFWYLACNPCKMEFPYLQEAYAEYADDVMVLAMNPCDSDNAAISQYAQELNLTFPMGACDKTWEKAMNLQAYPTTVVIDRFGTIAMLHTGSITDAKTFKDIFAFFTAEDYTQTVVENVEDIVVVEEQEGTASTPVDINGQTSFQLTVAPGQLFYVNIHKMTNVWLQVKNSNIYVEYNGKKYNPSNGVVGLMVSAPSTFDPARVVFGNKSDKEQTFTVTLSSLPGSYANPYELKLGQFTTNVSAGNNQGVYFTYTAPEDGNFSLQCLGVSPSSVKYDFSVMNLTTSVMRSLADDGQADEATGKQVVTMPMNAGEKLRITISALPDETNNYPAATFTMLASFQSGDVEDVVVEEKIAYAVTITDENRLPIPGVHVSLAGTQENSGSFVTDENGVFSGYMVKDTYTGTVVIPSGYKATTASFVLTPEMPMLSLKLDTFVIEYADYAIRVVDEEGNGVAGVMITIGTTFGTTDENGCYTVNLEKGDYTVTIGAPEGYKLEQTTYQLTGDTTTLGVTLQDAQEELIGIPYVVKVVDAAGIPVQDVLITFWANGESVGMAPVDDNGVAALTLPAGDYTVTLTSATGAVLGHDAAQAVLSPDKTETTIAVATEVGGDNFLADWWGNYYVLTNGSYQVDLTNTINYSEDYECWWYVFAPKVSGVYTLKISGNSVLGHYGSTAFPFGPSMSTETDGYFQITVKEGEFANDHQPSVVLGVKAEAGVQNAIVTITRTDDAPLEVPVITYEPTCEMNAFKENTGAVTYMDVEKANQIEKGSDGYYYYNGKKLYVNLSLEAPFVTFSNMLGLQYVGGQWADASTGTGLKGHQVENGEITAIIDFTQCMRDYITLSNPNTGLYPLNDDLVYMLQNAGEFQGWWNIDHPNYLFATKPNLNTESAWLFAVCYCN